MSIPARPDYDPDLVISASLSDVPRLIAAVREYAARAERLEQAMTKLVKAVEALELAGEAEDYMMFEEALDDYWGDVDTAKREAEALLARAAGQTPVATNTHAGGSNADGV